MRLRDEIKSMYVLKLNAVTSPHYDMISNQRTEQQESCQAVTKRYKKWRQATETSWTCKWALTRVCFCPAARGILIVYRHMCRSAVTPPSANFGNWRWPTSSKRMTKEYERRWKNTLGNCCDRETKRNRNETYHFYTKIQRNYVSQITY